MENSILFGNGLNQLLGKDKYPKWEDLILSAGRGSKDKQYKANFPLRFEIALANKVGQVVDHDSIEKKRIQNDLKKTIVKIISDIDSFDIELYEKIVEIDFCDYMTTNYDNFLFRYCRLKGFKKIYQDRTEDIYSLRRRYVFDVKGKKKTIWNIHGDIEQYKSMILGYDQYCGNIWKLNEYIKGSSYKYNVPGGKRKTHSLSIISRIRNATLFDEENNELRTWCDNFFTKNVHIIGLGLYFDEIDLWWILIYRNRLIHGPKVGNLIDNKIYFYEIEEDEEKHNALKALGVEVCLVDKSHIQHGSDDKISNWKELYLELLEKMKKNIQTDHAELEVDASYFTL